MNPAFISLWHRLLRRTLLQQNIQQLSTAVPASATCCRNRTLRSKKLRTYKSATQVKLHRISAVRFKKNYTFCLTTTSVLAPANSILFLLSRSITAKFMASRNAIKSLRVWCMPV